MQPPYNPFNFHNKHDCENDVVIRSCGKPIQTNLNHLLEKNELRKMSIEEFNEYKNKLTGFRKLENEEEFILKGIERKLKSLESLKKCRKKKKIELELMSKEIIEIKEKTVELKKQNESITQVLCDCQNCNKHLTKIPLN
ncbi:hypothetical protein EHI8A_072930 [Entamoeba histolytica HM-1:IMSS-B]|uniref:Basic leucine zipper domain-containing protein n=6 Tax=Entamoeba histolytica TaxID=5759 RepID=C4M5R8_ENTH1|nr:hypothetical protein EHI_129940 [Entamoeba histolytica HM-1:IMSS]EMD45907.1 Hypothetical protein EHI5A_066890 [Entamoeba histolytica KU27]EMH75327.1 hypothetical protein EHI8A_072930 [Entamoeba histolytica HM-1:IMSS-B]EMS11947.1 hypothetical protein KM1_020320 [Entamoeba histolytica HM-3:IMSS]ENY62790.1 hypothetical protein EHI7A_105520 [Entamoeba histolytica HM-1:IMSS-A]GAT96781.1 hypothetical protein CL6EHI_129940 [Entamoeba histolytica]|eukprot:XP_651820.1 hypothetical protein EHI_129940 [Entamoeba histolytica HM-1:IMSS]